MDYTGKVCPFCQTQFKEGDDVVVCSICEMPHHKDCWIENAACTTFGCTGTISGVNKEGVNPTPQSSQQIVTPGTQGFGGGMQAPVPPGVQVPVPQNTYTMFLQGGAGAPSGNMQHPISPSNPCPNCGALCPVSYRFCNHCGTSLPALPSQQNPNPGQPVQNQPINTSVYHQPASPPVYGQTNAYAPPAQGKYTPPSAAWQQSAYNQPGSYGQPMQGGFYNQSIPFDQELAAFIGENSHYYLQKKADMARSNSTVSWNWCSFLFSSNWLIYRKMYGPAILLWLVNMIIPSQLFVINLGIAIAMGMMGNNIYLKHAERKVAESRTVHPAEKAAFLARHGGTSIGAVFALIGIGVLAVFFFSVLFL